MAFRKPANQSTTVRGGAAANGNDGEKTTEHDGKRCTETQREASPWWQVDLLRHYAVKVVRVTTRGCCGESMHRYLLILSASIPEENTTVIGNVIYFSELHSCFVVYFYNKPINNPKCEAITKT